MKDTIFYNEESTQYSAKRYPAYTKTFTQFFFRSRLAIALHLSRALPQPFPYVLEVGCADGVVARAFAHQFPNVRGHFTALDLSPEMIRVARELTSPDQGIEYCVRGEGKLPENKALILELGVLNYLDVSAEIPAIFAALNSDGTYICSVAGNTSIQFKLKGGEYQNILSYSDYEKLFKKHFQIVRRIPVGYFVPWLWKVPVFARPIQSMIEYIGSRIAPHAALEIVYELKKHT